VLLAAAAAAADPAPPAPCAEPAADYISLEISLSGRFRCDGSTGYRHTDRMNFICVHDGWTCKCRDRRPAN